MFLFFFSLLLLFCILFSFNMLFVSCFARFWNSTEQKNHYLNLKIMLYTHDSLLQNFFSSSFFVCRSHTISALVCESTSYMILDSWTIFVSSDIPLFGFRFALHELQWKEKYLAPSQTCFNCSFVYLFFSVVVVFVLFLLLLFRFLFFISCDVLGFFAPINAWMACLMHLAIRIFFRVGLLFSYWHR